MAAVLDDLNSFCPENILPTQHGRQAFKIWEGDDGSRLHLVHTRLLLAATGVGPLLLGPTTTRHGYPPSRVRNVSNTSGDWRHCLAAGGWQTKD